MVALLDEIVRFLLVTDNVLSLSEMVSAIAVVRFISSTVVVAFRPLNDASTVELDPSEVALNFVTCVIESLPDVPDELDKSLVGIDDPVAKVFKSSDVTVAALAENSVTFWIGTTVIVITCVNALEEVRSLARIDESLDRIVESLAAIVVERGRSLSGTLVILDSAMVRSLAGVAVELAELVV